MRNLQLFCYVWYAKIKIMNLRVEVDFMMRYALFLLFVFPLSVFGLSCPNNAHLIDKGDTINYILNKCGNPLSQREYKNTVALMQKWTYYKTNNPMDPNNSALPKSKIVIIFNNGRVDSIHLNEGEKNAQNVVSTNACGRIIQTTNGMQDVEFVCGTPAEKNDLQSNTTAITELTYSGSSPNVLVFEDGKLSEIK